ncbi:hypothetical protein [Streptomyces sp. NPDC001851]|uniref:hypothetical protein n=1 Tax=Streptomyces sp. NPDC001851 TaxID=3154529 RepID=UPI0033204080
MTQEPRCELDNDPLAKEVSDAQYHVVAARRQAVEDRAWQVPAIIFAAQALLLNAATAHEVSRAASVAAGFAAAFVAAMAANLIMRQRRNQLAEYAWLRDFERMRRWDLAHHDSDVRADRVKELDMCRVGQRVAGIKPHVTWLIGTLVLGLLGLALSIYVIATGNRI